MKSVIEPLLVGIVGTVTILAVILPPAIVKITVDKETLFTYSYEKVQNILLTLFRLKQDGKEAYQILSEKALFEDFTCKTTSCPFGYTCKAEMCNGPTTEPLKKAIDKVAGSGYCITTDEPISTLPTEAKVITGSAPPSNEVLKRVCAKTDVIFDTVIVLPYNKASLIKLIMIGVQ